MAKVSVRDDCDNVLTNEKKRDKAHSHSCVRVVSDNGHVVIGARIVQCNYAIMDVVIGVRIMKCYHAIMATTFGTNFNLVPSSTCSQFQLVVKLYELIVTFPCSHFLHTFAPRKRVI